MDGEDLARFIEARRLASNGKSFKEVTIAAAGRRASLDLKDEGASEEPAFEEYFRCTEVSSLIIDGLVRTRRYAKDLLCLRVAHVQVAEWILVPDWER